MYLEIQLDFNNKMPYIFSIISPDAIYLKDIFIIKFMSAKQLFLFKT